MGFPPAAHSLDATDTCYSSLQGFFYSVVVALTNIYHAYVRLSTLFAFVSL